MTPEDLERRKRRRERNKHAAAKCRQRRVDQTNELLEVCKLQPLHLISQCFNNAICSKVGSWKFYQPINFCAVNLI